MVRASGSAPCSAYATRENADVGGSGLLGPVQLRGALGRLWLHGRRIPLRHLWAHAGERLAGRIWNVIWRIVGGILDYESSSGSWLPDGRGPRLDELCEDDELRLNLERRPVTVSWPVHKGRLVSISPIARSVVSHSEAAFPARMGVRGVTPKMAEEVLDKARKPALKVRLEVPLGPRGGTRQLYLEISSEHATR